MPQNGLLRLNERVQIEKQVNEQCETYSSYVAAVTDTTLDLAAPLAKGIFVPFRVGEKIRVVAWPLSFITEVLERQFLPEPVLVVKRPESFSRVQRRRFVRFEERLPLTVQVLEKNDSNEQVVWEAKTETLDISGGGCLFLLERAVSEGTTLEVELFLPEKVVCRAKVTRCCPEDIGEKVRVGAEFTNIKRTDQDRIVRHIFQRQLELRQKGLL
ncbi:MAG: hypothetical protein GX062_04155 [Firmicutes bacterium]|jgi:c-di-GMP-binding flagellar brake protein YcgR|nr:hypothetical protein [Bacillota bacterium]